MKRIPLLIALLMMSMPALAQEGTVTYNETVKIDIELPPEMESMRDQIPSSRTAAKQLLFSPSATLMRTAPTADEDEGVVEMGGEGIRIRMDMGGSADEALFMDLDEGVMVDKREFLGRTFRVMGEQPEYAWRLTGEQSEFLGFACQKAVATQDDSTVEAWFTAEIPVSAGPGPYSGLPGLILVVSVDDGQMTYTATEVAMDGVDLSELVAPDGGREVSKEEFDEIVDEKMKEMGAERGRGGGMQVRIRH